MRILSSASFPSHIEPCVPTIQALESVDPHIHRRKSTSASMNPINIASPSSAPILANENFYGCENEMFLPFFTNTFHELGWIFMFSRRIRRGGCQENYKLSVAVYSKVTY